MSGCYLNTLNVDIGAIVGYKLTDTHSFNSFCEVYTESSQKVFCVSLCKKFYPKPYKREYNFKNLYIDILKYVQSKRSRGKVLNSSYFKRTKTDFLDTQLGDEYIKFAVYEDIIPTNFYYRCTERIIKLKDLESIRLIFSRGNSKNFTPPRDIHQAILTEDLNIIKEVISFHNPDADTIVIFELYHPGWNLNDELADYLFISLNFSKNNIKDVIMKQLFHRSYDQHKAKILLDKYYGELDIKIIYDLWLYSDDLIEGLKDYPMIFTKDNIKQFIQLVITGISHQDRHYDGKIYLKVLEVLYLHPVYSTCD